MPHARAWADIERKRPSSKPDHLRAMTTVVADTGDLGAVSQARRLHDESNDRPESCRHFRVQDVVDEALAWQRGRVATLYASLPRLPTGSQSLLESSCCGLCRATCRLRWTATCPRTPQHRWRGATRSSTPTNREPSGPSACSSNSYRRWEGPRQWLRDRLRSPA